MQNSGREAYSQQFQIWKLPLKVLKMCIFNLKKLNNGTLDRSVFIFFIYK